MDPIELLSQLVAIPSQNPMGSHASGPDYLETRLTDHLETLLRPLGVPLQRDPVLPGRDNLLAVYASDPQAPVLVFDVHQDTVPADPADPAPFDPVIRDGRLHGRGACDVKGSMAAMISAFARLVRERPRGAASVILAFTVDEEYTHRGSSRLANLELNADLAIVAEPTGLQPVDTHKGAVRWTIRTDGVACHSSRPRDGVNAIYRMAPVLAGLERYAASLDHRPPHPRLGHATLSVGRITGGVAANIVPESCTIQVDRRLLPGEAPEDAREEVNQYLRDHFPAAAFEAGEPWVRMPSLDSASAARWIGPVSEIVSSVLGRDVEPGAVPYGTDAGPLSRAGLPSLVLGPGDIAQAHTVDEWIELDQVHRAVEVYYRLATDLRRPADG